MLPKLSVAGDLSYSNRCELSTRAVQRQRSFCRREWYACVEQRVFCGKMSGYDVDHAQRRVGRSTRRALDPAARTWSTPRALDPAVLTWSTRRVLDSAARTWSTTRHRRGRPRVSWTPSCRRSVRRAAGRSGTGRRHGRPA